MTRTGAVLGVGLLWALAARAADTIQPLDVKPGLWEVTRTTSMSGKLPISPKMLAQMSPEQRAKLEAMLESRGDQAPRTTTDKHCVTKEDLKKSDMFGGSDRCNRTVVTSTRRKVDARMECDEEGMKRTGSLKLEAADSEHVQGAMQMAASGGERAMNVSSTFSARWIGPTCTKDDASGGATHSR